MDSQKAVPSKTVIPRKISQITTSQNVENQLRPTLRRCRQYQGSLHGTKLAGRDSQAPYLPEPIFCCLSPNFPSVSSICWQVSILHQELEGGSSIQGYKMTFSSTPHHERISKAVVSREEGLLITEEVQSLKKRVIFQVKDQSLDTRTFYSTLFIVLKKGGERHPIIHLKPLNRFIPHIHLKM